MSLTDQLHTLLTQRHALSFAEFMHFALYTPVEGYYSSSLPKFGPTGDFITAPELTPLFGKTLANQCQQIFAHLTEPCLLEFGAGTGRLCVDILTQLEQLECMPKYYYILELSAFLRARQQELIHTHLPHLYHHIVWLDSMPEQSFNGVIIANEVLDAMPVHRFLWDNDEVLESFIRLDSQQQLKETFEKTTNKRLIDYVIKRLPKLSAPYLSEVNLFIDGWLASIFTVLKQGAVLLIDYGFPRHEYYHPDRTQGTLMCHYQQHAHSNPLIHIGQQDITAHVDFTHIAEAGHAAGFNVAGYTNQASFLLANGLFDAVHLLDNALQQLDTNHALKILLQPHEMGELFKVIALTKHIDIRLNGFLLHDKRGTL